jgi:hypothetical protein
MLQLPGFRPSFFHFYKKNCFPILHTVFSTTQPDHSITLKSTSAILKIKMLIQWTSRIHIFREKCYIDKSGWYDICSIHMSGADFMNNSDGRWNIYELKLPQMQGVEGEAVVYYRETRHNATDGARSTRPKGKRCRS